MTAVCENILRADLVKSENFANIVMPNGRRLFESRSQYIYAADTADSLRRFYASSLDRLATFKGGQPLFDIPITQILSPMPNGKNLTATARGASASTPTARKSVSKTVSVIPLRARRQISRLESSLKTECAAKNQAYSFILASGHLNDFVSFSKRTRGLDSHVLCQGVLVSDYVKSLIPAAL